METILIIDDEEFIRENLRRILGKEGYETKLASCGREGVNIISSHEVDVVLLDINLPDINGMDVLKKIKNIAPHTMVIVITGYATVDSAVEALKLGAYDYIKKPFKADAIKLIIKLAIETQSLKKEVTALKKLGRKDEEIIAESPAMKEALKLAAEVAKHADTNVLITGESGTGKEIVAKLTHEKSSRHDKPFIDINCANVPEQLLESELFGYEKGAFTDARTTKTGLFEEASGGTIFFDEIGEMPLPLQTKILRVIETKAIRKIGGGKNIFLDVRVVAATNKDLKEAVEKRLFREDLFYRLNVFPIHLRPLRERKEDIFPLSVYYLKKYAKIFRKRFERIDAETRGILESYRWQGNVRELKNMMERICIMNDDAVLKIEHLPADLVAVSEMEESLEEDINGADSLSRQVAEFEKKLIKDALKNNNDNTLKTARFLKIPRGTLRHKIDKYKI